MLKQLSSTVLVIVLMLVGFVEQENGQQADQTFTFRRGQSVYIYAVVHRTNALGLGKNSGHSLHNDITYEAKLRKRFEERKIFKVANKLNDADFVFLVNIEEDGAEGLAISLETYKQFKKKEDFDVVREAPYGRYLVGPYFFSTHGKVSSKLVDKFLKEAVP